MNDLDKYIQDLSMWRGETIETIKKLNKNMDLLFSNQNKIKENIANLKVLYENRLTTIETKLKILSAIAYVSLAGLITLIVELILRI